jgi:membrane protein implicated in regulation of membrane protease activity
MSAPASRVGKSSFMIFGAILRFILAFWTISVLSLLLAVACSVLGYRLAGRRARRSRPEQIGSRAQRRATTIAFKHISRTAPTTATTPGTQDGPARLAGLVQDEGSEV